MRDNCTTRFPDDLQRQAEAVIADRPLPGGTSIETDHLKLLHELQVHKTELKLQNDELRRAQVELEASWSHLFELYDLAPVGYCTLSTAGLILQANLTASTLFGVALQDVVNQPFYHFILMEDRDIFHLHIQALILTGERQTCDLRMVRNDGTVIWLKLCSVSAHDADHRRLCNTTISDITESKQLEKALREQKEFFLQIAENLSDFVAVLDLEGRRIYNSPSYQHFFGATEDLRNTDSFADIHPDDRERVKQIFRETVQTGQGHHIEYRFLMNDGSVRDMESRGSVIKDSDGRVERVVVVSRDITEHKQLQAQVRHMAFHDALTGLPNRRLFSDRLGQAMAASTRSACYGALMFLDLDNFKSLNDAHGHEIGDLLLMEAADRLKRCVREMDTVARLGGDEFVVMLSQLDTDKAESIAQAGTVAEKLRVALAEPYLLPTTNASNAETTVEHQCSASIGVTLFHDHETSQSDILKRADSAMYQAKQGGRDQIRLCDLE